MFSLRRIKIMVLLSCALAAVSLVAVGYTDANAGAVDVGTDVATLSTPDGPIPRLSPGHRGPRPRGASCRSSTPSPNSDYSTPTLPPPPAVWYCDDEGRCYLPHRADD